VKDEETAVSGSAGQRAVRHGRVSESGVGRVTSSARRRHYFDMLAADCRVPVTITDTDSVSDSLRHSPAQSHPAAADMSSRELPSSDVIIHRHGVVSSSQHKSCDTGHLLSRDVDSDITDTQHAAVQSTSQQSVPRHVYSSLVSLCHFLVICTHTHSAMSLRGGHVALSSVTDNHCQLHTDSGGAVVGVAR